MSEMDRVKDELWCLLGEIKGGDVDDPDEIESRVRVLGSLAQVFSVEARIQRLVGEYTPIKERSKR